LLRKPISPGAVALPWEFGAGLRAAAWRASLPLRGGAGARVRARAPAAPGPAGSARCPGCLSLAGRADPASRGGAGLGAWARAARDAGEFVGREPV